MGDLSLAVAPTTTPWQVSLQTSASKWLHVWQNNILTDVSFKVGANETEISSHKIILVLHSPVFESMFGQRWNSGVNANGGVNCATTEISLPEEDEEIFRIFLNFVYSGNISTSDPDKIISTLMLAKKYLCHQLIKKCIEVLKESLNVSNVIHIHQVAELLDEKELHKSSEEYILHNANSLFTSGEISQMNKTDLCRLLQNDELNVPEIDLFNAVYSWGKFECQRLGLDDNNSIDIADALQGVIPLIRFTNMSPEDFSSQVVPKKVLALEDTVKIFTFMTTPQNKRPEVEPELDLKFNTTKRSLSYFVYNLKRLKGHGFDFGSKWQNLCFETDRNIRVISLGFFRPTDPTSEVEIGMKIMSYDLTETYAEVVETEFKCTTTEDVFHIKFKSPVKIQANTVYTISYIVKGKETFYKTVGESTIVCNCGAEGKVTFKFKEAINDTDMDQVPEICFRL